MSWPRSVINFISLSLLVCVLASPTVAKTDGKAEACKRLADEIRVRVDRIISGDPLPRLVVALEAHKRLQCPVDDLLSALNMPPSGVSSTETK